MGEIRIKIEIDVVKDNFNNLSKNDQMLLLAVYINNLADADELDFQMRDRSQKPLWDNFNTHF